MHSEREETARDHPAMFPDPTDSEEHHAMFDASPSSPLREPHARDGRPAAAARPQGGDADAADATIAFAALLVRHARRSRGIGARPRRVA